ncbi:hypothetical protein CBS63078_8368 [Aspergillus niger]|nr:hypothetical protein CBS115989_5504 [Aspergillus niger]KAI2827267.1 hypothetical protein CBS133816_6703 [Aspergillus niger]KAI2841519.1 hypothetical protein CBS11350_6353 [Aspergillus niger]KAI2843503.1 hypothetical protein CBS11232_8261 [Aspergillus niger]KAI2846361.1 hypothetical protein CBS12448_9565 [Aspergillus niger]
MRLCRFRSSSTNPSPNTAATCSNDLFVVSGTKRKENTVAATQKSLRRRYVPNPSLRSTSGTTNADNEVSQPNPSRSCANPLGTFGTGKYLCGKDPGQWPIRDAVGEDIQNHPTA